MLTPLITRSPDCKDWLASNALAAAVELLTVVNADAVTPVRMVALLMLAAIASAEPEVELPTSIPLRVNAPAISALPETAVPPLVIW